MGRLAVLGVGSVLVVGLGLTLSACAPEPTVPMPVPTSTPSASSSAAPDDSAEGQRPLFDATNEDTATRLGTAAKGRDFIDALVAAGFDKTAMQLTPDATAIGLSADNIQFSVQIDEECMVGQYGNVGYASAILPAIDTAGCLVGNTRAIDW
jgi:hypothetical protein